MAFWECNNATEQDNEQLFNDGASSPDENTSGRHGSIAVFGAFDGSAGLMQITEWTDKMGEASATRFQVLPRQPEWTVTNEITENCSGTWRTGKVNFQIGDRELR